MRNAHDTNAQPNSRRHDVAFRAENLGLSFYDERGRAIRVLRNIDLELTKNEILAILGPSGCGKTSLLRLIAGLLAPTSGSLVLDPALADNRGILMSMVFQKPTLLPWISIEDNVLLPYRLGRITITTGILERVDRLLRIVHLQGFREAYPSDLSGGMQMRTALVRAFATQPRLILMDEPFSALDETTRFELCIEMLDLVDAAQSSVVFVTHSIQEAAFIANRIVQLSARPGRIVAELRPDFSVPRNLALFNKPEFLGLCAQLRGPLAHD